MKLFINDIGVNIHRLDKGYDPLDYNVLLDADKDKLAFSKFFGNVLIIKASTSQIDQLFKEMKRRKFKTLKSVTFAVDDHESTSNFVRDKFTIVKAAGGLVVKNGKFLMIYRLEKWDLPKGKLEKNEKSKVGAVREVEEECNIKVKLGKKLVSTWHTYTRNGKSILKKTSWYLMESLDDSEMKPQLEENIQEVRWMNKKEVDIALYTSYPSIKHVFAKFWEQATVD